MVVESVLKPRHVKEPEPDPQFNYLVDITTKWYRSYFYFCSRYACPGPYALSPFFEDKFARMEYIGDGPFNLAYMRHTGQWFDALHRVYRWTHAWRASGTIPGFTRDGGFHARNPRSLTSPNIRARMAA